MVDFYVFMFKAFFFTVIGISVVSGLFGSGSD